MNCKNCGILLTSGDKFCKNCGAPVVSEPVQQSTLTPPIMSETTPVWNNPVQKPVCNIPTKKSNPIGIILIVLLVIGLLVGGYFGINYLLKDSKNAPNNSNDQVFFSDTEAEDIECGDYTFKVSTDYSYSCDNNTINDVRFPTQFVLFDWDGNSIMYYVMDDTVDIELLENNIESFESFVQNFSYQSYDTSNFKIETINKIKMLTFKCILDEDEQTQNMVGAIIPIKLEKSLYIFVSNEDNEYDYELIKEATKMIEDLL